MTSCIPHRDLRGTRISLIPQALELKLQWSLQSINLLIKKVVEENEEELNLFIQRMISLSIEKDQPIGEGFTPLYYCADKGYLELVEILLDCGADSNAIDSQNGSSILNQAIYRHKLEPDKKYYKIIQVLIENNANVNFQAFNGQTPLLLTTSIGNIDIFDLLVAAGADITLCDNNGTTVLLQAIKSKQFHMLEYLLSNKFNGEDVVDVNKCDNKGQVPIIQMIESAFHHTKVEQQQQHKNNNNDDGDDDVMKGVRLLLEKGATVVEDDNMKRCVSPSFTSSALSCASKIGRLDIINVLLESGAVDIPDVRGINSLIEAADKGFHTITRRLVEKLQKNEKIEDKYINLRDKYLDTALHHACSMCNDCNDYLISMSNRNKLEERNYYKTIQILLKSGIDVNLRNRQSEIALHIALRRDLSDEIVQLLIEAGSNIELRDRKNNNALDIASLKCKKVIVEMLLKKGANVNQKDNDGETPLYQSCYSNGLKTSMALIVAGADPLIANVNGCTPLYWAVWNGNLNLTKALIVAGADVNQATNMNITPVSVACNMGHEKVLKLLIENDADINKADNDLRSPLLKACFQGRVEIVSILIEADANLTFKSESNVTPFGIACRRGHIEIMTLLLNSGIDPLSGVKDAFLKDDIDVFKVLLAAGIDSYECQKYALAKTQKDIICLLKWYRYRALLLMRVKTIADCASKSPTPAELNPTKIGGLLTDKCTDEAKAFRQNVASFF